MRSSIAPGRLVLLLAVCVACGGGQPPVLPPGVTGARLATVDPDSPIAWSPDGKNIAVASAGLVVVGLDGSQRRITDRSPTAIAWSPNGAAIAAAFADGDDDARATLGVFDPGGNATGRAAVGGRVSHLFWTSDTDILAGALVVKSYSFGANVQARMYNWNGTDAPVAVTLAERTVSKAVAEALRGRLAEASLFALSPLGTEVLYAYPAQPPVFPARLELRLRHLETGLEKEVTHLPLLGGGALPSADGERVLVATQDGASVWLDPWTGTTAPGFEVAGWNLARAPSGRYTWLDGLLFDDSRQVGEIPGAGKAAFSPDSRRLAVVARGRLRLYSGLVHQPAPAPSPAVRAELQTLRRLLFQELITRDDYLRSARKVRAR